MSWKLFMLNITDMFIFVWFNLWKWWMFLYVFNSIYETAFSEPSNLPLNEDTWITMTSCVDCLRILDWPTDWLSNLKKRLTEVDISIQISLWFALVFNLTLILHLCSNKSGEIEGPVLWAVLLTSHCGG